MKKLLSVILAVSIVLGMTINASAYVIINGGNGGPPISNPVTSVGSGVLKGSVIKSINEDDYITNMANIPAILNDKTNLSLDDLNQLDVNPGDVIKIPMKGVYFLDKNGDSFANYGAVALSALEYANISVKSSSTQGQGLMTASIGGNSSNSYIKLEFKRTPAHTGQKFAYSIYLSKNGSRRAETRISVKGIVESEEKEVGFGDEYVDISDGTSVRATSTVRNIDIYIGEYCTVTRTLVKGGEYSGVAIADILNSDVPTLDAYPEIEYIYRLETVNLKATGNIVRFDLDGKYYVYNSFGNYIGTSDNALPYWTKYYMSAKKYPVLKVKAAS